MADVAVIRVATLNLRNTSDRWPERAPLLVSQFVDLRPDVIGLQEVRVPAKQAHYIASEVNARLPAGEPRYEVRQANKTGLAGRREGIAVLSRLPFLEHEALDLHGGNRVAQRARLGTREGAALDFYNTHLHHERAMHDLRDAQARRILEWMDARPGAAARVLVGDFNAKPDEPAAQRIMERLRSVYSAVHGREPDCTAPTPLSAEWGQASHVIDYIFVDDTVEVRDARVTFQAVDDGDPHLCASDHYGLAADVLVGPASR